MHDRSCCDTCCGGCCASADRNRPKQPTFKHYAKKASFTGPIKSVNELQAEDPSFRNWSASDPDDFEDIEGGHKRFNRSWLTSNNPMTAPEKTLLEGDEALFSLGMLG